MVVSHDVFVFSGSPVAMRKRTDSQKVPATQMKWTSSLRSRYLLRFDNKSRLTQKKIALMPVMVTR